MSKRGDKIIYSIRRDGRSYWVKAPAHGALPVGIVRPAATPSGKLWDACDSNGRVYLEGRALPDRDAAAAVVLDHAEDI